MDAINSMVITGDSPITNMAWIALTRTTFTRCHPSCKYNFYFLRPEVWIGELSLGAIMLETVGGRRHWDPPHDTCHTGTMGKYFQMWLIKIFFKSDISSSRKMIIITKYQQQRDTVSGTMAMTWTHSDSAHRCVIDNMLLFIWLSWHAPPVCVFSGS